MESCSLSFGVCCRALVCFAFATIIMYYYYCYYCYNQNETSSCMLPHISSRSISGYMVNDCYDNKFKYIQYVRIMSGSLAHTILSLIYYHCIYVDPTRSCHILDLNITPNHGMLTNIMLVGWLWLRPGYNLLFLQTVRYHNMQCKPTHQLCIFKHRRNNRLFGRYEWEHNHL